MIKCLVWDLDGTVWKGTLAEGDAPVLRETVYETLMEADARGVIQSIASRNDPSAARQALETMGIQGLFLFPQIDPYIVKYAALREIAGHFNISADSVVFVDDDPFERYETNRFIPEVYTYSADELFLLREQIQSLPDVSPKRREWMRRREARLAAEKAFTGSRAEFLAECRMTLTVREAGERDLPRVTELALRAHKINTLVGTDRTSPVRSKEELCVLLQGYCRESDKRLYVCELTDIFGEHGLTGAGAFRRNETGVYMDLFCVSCRVEGRGVAAAFLHAALSRLCAEMPDASTVYCRIGDTREGMAFTLLKSLGFHVSERDGASALLVLALPYTGTGVSWIRVE